ncbi:hypothetical protein SD70_07355 [Gordoniibacillus kamchatkensis]|uniref:Uncharacterized protein n=1 Tax=Gordoniibacillus kamchatkensis TaxID=1590651 RepID=A0ABR5AK93_9BACL|nr:hypothetical protein [Paenibacillus sp. VKM B-2647]KIL41446.1 hypothetical protein SD70_07355 [Paenibacillus sp. VKM B-2647]
MSTSHQQAAVIFNKLVVTNIEDASGIFIGTNQAFGWSTYHKSNQGLGSLSGTTLTNAVSVLYDQDVIDAAVDDVRYIALTDAANNNQQCAVQFQSVNANAVSTVSAIGLGDNKQLGWRSSRKINYGTSKNVGSNWLRRFAGLVMDNDAVDAPVHMEGKIVERTGGTEPNIRIVQKPRTE